MNKTSVVIDGHTVSYWKYQLIDKLYKENNLNKIYLTNHGARGGDWFGTANFGENYGWKILGWGGTCLLYTSPSPRDRTTSRMPSSA